MIQVADIPKVWKLNTRFHCYDVELCQSIAPSLLRILKKFLFVIVCPDCMFVIVEGKPSNG